MNVFLTLDYELFFGSDSGTPEKSLIYPTARLMEIMDEYNVKSTFFVDSGYIVKLIENMDKYPKLRADYEMVSQQLKCLANAGHDLQLHIHPHWEDVVYCENKWLINTQRYRLHDFTEHEIERIVYQYKQVLYDFTSGPIVAFRAGGWCVQPFSQLASSLRKNHIWIDSSVFKGGRKISLSHYFDFQNAPGMTYWRFGNDLMQEQSDGYFVELPISSRRVSTTDVLRMAYSKILGGNQYKSFGDGKAISSTSVDILRMLSCQTFSVVSMDGYKAVWLKSSFQKFLDSGATDANFVIIGHPKLFSEFSLNRLKSFLRIHSGRYRFCTISGWLHHDHAARYLHTGASKIRKYK